MSESIFVFALLTIVYIFCCMIVYQVLAGQNRTFDIPKNQRWFILTGPIGVAFFLVIGGIWLICALVYFIFWVFGQENTLELWIDEVLEWFKSWKK